MAKVKRFKAVLEKGQRALGWTIARVPFGPEELGEMVRLRVQGSVNGFAFRTSLFPEAGGGGFYLLVNQAMQEGAGVRLGDVAEIRLEADLEAREAELPDELAVLIDEEPGLRGWYDELTEYTRREIGKWVCAVKDDAARMRRAEQMAERLLAAMEGEQELPPVIEAAFRKRPKARVGWAKMTEVQRRSELLAVFYYRTVDAQQRRVEKLVEAAEKRSG
ncbi:MAG TPA: YdeI/OmpD-associated family protein [Acidobacteriaceae bacterium]|nr:YdeI/OmpD-associated family protein [Acidobacteriaceae bacterium]